ncbi:MAG: helix-turn-helix domain-containing protein [Nakamurella sp.]
MLEMSSAGVDPRDVVDRVEFAAALTTLRERAGLTVRDLAKQAVVPTATVSGYLSGRHLPNPSQSEALLSVLTACGVVGTKQHEAWLTALRRVRQAPGRRSAAGPSPYPGLVSFQPEDASFFFGRAELIADIQARLIDIHEGRSEQGIVVVTGPSGSGKSSVLRAGVIPRAPEMGMTPLVMTPGEQPCDDLARVLADYAGLSPSDIVALFGDGDGRALSVLLSERESVLLVVDQAEEIFTACTDSTRRSAFLQQLQRLTEDTDFDGRRRVVVVLALRADFYSAAADEPVLLPVLRHSQVVVGTMTRSELTEAIVGPAAAVGLHVEDALVQTLLDDLAPRDRPGSAHDRGALPLLAHALHATWLASRRGRMTIDDYLATGGIAGAVERTAETVWADLDDESRELARRIFLRLVFVDDESMVTRRRVRLEELRGLGARQGSGIPDGGIPDGGIPDGGIPDGGIQGSGIQDGGIQDGGIQDGGIPGISAERNSAIGTIQAPPVDSPTVTGVVELFADARLLTLRTDTVEISHEALIGAWQRLYSWIDADRSALRIHRQISDSARIWQHAGRDESYLLRSGRLAVMEDLQESGRVTLNDVEQAFIAASTRQQSERLELQRRQRTRLVVALVTVAVLALVASGLAVMALRAEASANDRAVEATAARDDAQSRELAIAADRMRGSDPALAAQLSLVAYRIAPTVDARSAVLDTTALTLPTRIPAQEGPTFVAVDRAHAVTAVTGAVDGSVTLWSLKNPGRPSKIITLASTQPDVQQFSVAISPDGRQLAAGDAKGLVERWDISNPAAPRGLPGPGVEFPSGVLGLAFSPDGRQLAAGGEGGSVRLWNVGDLSQAVALPKIPGPELVSSLAWAPDGHTLWAGDSGGTVTGWSVDDGRQVSTSRSAGGPSAPITFATGPSTVSALAVSPDGSVLAAGTKRGELHLWRRAPSGAWVADEHHPTPLAGWLDTIAFAPDGSNIALGGTGNQIRVVRTSDLVEQTAMVTPGPVTGVSYVSADHLEAGSSDGFTRIWPVPGSVVGPVGDAIFGLKMVNPERLVVGASPKAGALLSYNVADRDAPVRYASPPAVDDIRLDGIFVASSDQKMVAMGSGDGRVQMWDTSDANRAATMGPPFQAAGALVETMALSADDKVLAVGSDSSVVNLWDVTNPAAPKPLAETGNVGGLPLMVAFQPGRPVMALGTTNGNVLMWDVSDPAHPRQIADLKGLDGYALAISFSPDGTILAEGGTGRVIRLWNVSDPAHATPIGSPLEGFANDIGAVAFSPDGHRLMAATSSGVVWMWDVRNPASPQLLAKARAADGVLNAAVWSPDGSTFAAGGSAQKVWIWTADAKQASADICAVAGAGITAAEWKLYVQERAYDPPCS